MQVSAELLRELTDVINALSSDLQPKAKALVDKIARRHANRKGCIPPDRVAAFRADVVAAMDALCSGATDIAAVHASDMYDKVRAAAGVGSSYSAVAESFRDPAKTDGAIRALVQSVVRTGTTDVFASECASRLDYEIRRAAEDCIIGNAERDPANPKWARVPTGVETCSFCLMLASFGANYNERNSISHVHKGCDCRMVQMYDGMSIDGYDPDRAYVQTEKCLETIGGRDGLRKDWDALPESQRAAMIEKRNGDASRAFEAYVNKRVSKEMSTRDVEWLRTGKPCRGTIEAGAKPDKKDLKAQKLMLGLGFKADLRKAVDETNKRTADSFINGVSWEFKNPEGCSPKAVKNQLKKDVGIKGKQMQSDKVVITNVASSLTFEDMCAQLEALNEKGDFPQVTEVMIASTDGRLRRYKR